MEFPSNRAINKMRVTKFHERITAALAHPDLETFQSIIAQYKLDNEVTMEQVAAALAAMVQGKKPFLLREEFKLPTFESGRRPERDERGGGRYSSRERAPRERSARPGRPSSRSRDSQFTPSAELESYRIELGHAHQVKPGNIVGAIANEAGIDSAFIGRIEIFERHSVVDLPKDLPSEVLDAVGQAKIGGRALRISMLNGERPPRRRPERSRPERSRNK